MGNLVNEWVQEGRLFIWRYPKPKSGWESWHFTADPAGCRSIITLLDRMQQGGPCYRTLKLERVTDEILRVPNYGCKTAGRFSKVRIAFAPDHTALSLHAEDDMLRMVIGNERLPTFSAALKSVEIGDGDFGIGTSDDRNSLPWVFW